MSDSFEGLGWTELRLHWERCAKEQPCYTTAEDLRSLDKIKAGVDRLKQAGWQDIIYCPKDGSTFLAMDPNFGGIYPCHYEGPWPTGFWWIHDSGDLWPARPCLWRPMPKKTP